MVKKFKPRNEKFEIRKIPGNKIGRGEKNQYQDQIVQIRTDGWVAIRFREIFDLAIEIGLNEEKLYPQPRFQGYTKMLDEFKFQVAHGIEEKLANEKSRINH
tara:strand:- start:14 stop:319 length:306 start_codon:yes stop_codon:yes gene_type:complete